MLLFPYYLNLNFISYYYFLVTLISFVNLITLNEVLDITTQTSKTFL